VCLEVETECLLLGKLSVTMVAGVYLAFLTRPQLSLAEVIATALASHHVTLKVGKVANLFRAKRTH